MRRETRSAIRFGTGLGEGVARPTSVEGLLGAARKSAELKPRVSLNDRAAFLQSYRDENKAAMSEAAKKTARKKLAKLHGDDVRHMFAQAVTGPGFGERLVGFWADHFTVAANALALRVLAPDVRERAVRPHIMGRFPEMLRAVSFHPGMLIYLNQHQSIGPNSKLGKRRDRGLNENLAREILELHTLGVEGSYSQGDVRNFAELLTGLTVDKNGFTFRAAIAEPGPHEMLGRTYQGNPSRDLIEDALEDIAMHPETARHLARKLLVHFIGGEPENALVSRMADAYGASNGELSALYAVMLEAPLAWEGELNKAKPPFDYLVSALRGAGVNAKDIGKFNTNELRGLMQACQAMGQTLFQPNGPDGWPEESEAWITPPGLAARIRWAADFAQRIEPNHDPREFHAMVLGDASSKLLRRAVAGSERRVEGLALTLVSPEFNRR